MSPSPPPMIFSISPLKLNHQRTAGMPSLNSLDNASSTMMSSRLSADPWWTPTLTPNACYHDSRPFTLTAVSKITVVASSCIDWTTDTSYSSTPTDWCPPDHLGDLLRYTVKCFLKISESHPKSFFITMYFSCNYLTMKIASVVPLSPIMLNCMLSIFAFSHTYSSTKAVATTLEFWNWEQAAFDWTKGECYVCLAEMRLLFTG